MAFVLLVLFTLLLYVVTIYNSLSKLKKIIEVENKTTKRYRDAVKTYNSYIDKYPSKIIAKIIGFKKI